MLTYVLLCLAAGAPGKAVVAHEMPQSFFSASGETTGMGGFAPSGNGPVAPPGDYVRSSGLRVLVNPPYASDKKADPAQLLVWVVNDTDQAVVFSAQDSLIYMTRELKDANGEWHAIEHVQRSWCGNSYHTVALPAGKLWSFIAPVYAGKKTGTMRYRLQVAKVDETSVYSNEFESTYDPRMLKEGRGGR